MCYLEVTISTWAGGTALRAERGESGGRALPSSPYPFLQPFLALSQVAFSKNSMFLGGSVPADISSTSRKEQRDFTSPAHTPKPAPEEAASPQHETCPTPAGAGSPISGGSRGTDRVLARLPQQTTPSPAPKETTIKSFHQSPSFLPNQ